MKNILTIVLLLTGCMAFGQAEWTTLSSDNGINISYKKVHCDMNSGYDQEIYVLKFENTNAYKVSVIWDLELWFDGVCSTCEDPNGEYHKVIALKPGEVSEGSCTDGPNNELYFFSRFDDANFTGKDVRLTDFNLANMMVVDMTATRK